MIFLYALFALSFMCPVYTYALYPAVLKLMKGKEYISRDIKPYVTVIVLNGKGNASEKIANLHECDYENFEVLVADNISEGVNRAGGEILLFTDGKRKLDKKVIQEIVKPFADERIGAAVGQQTNPDGNSLFWKYENFVKRLESRIGCVSGANESVFAVRKSAMPKVPGAVKNVPFFIATSITQSGKEVIFEPSAKAYEEKSEGTNFQKHVREAAGYWQALILFPRMLLPRKGSFVYISHRVMKWFVWLNMITGLITSSVLGRNSMVIGIIFNLQVIAYIGFLLLGRLHIRGAIGKLSSIGYYFIMLNIAYFTGLLRRNYK